MSREKVSELTEAQIDNKILLSEKEQSKEWDSRMEEVKKAIDERFDKHETKIDIKLDKFLDTLEERRKDWETGLGERLDAQDTAIAAIPPSVKLVENKVDQNIEDVRHIRHRLRLLGWLIMASRGVMITARAVKSSAKEGKEIYAAVAAVCSLIVLVWSFFHTMLPTFQIWLTSHGH